MALPPITSAVANEQAKLTATALNNLALAFVVGGFVAPLLRLDVPGDTRALSLFFWLGLGVGVHVCGRLVLRSLRP
jgi:hypothetical protein